MRGDVKSTHMPASGEQGKLPVRHLRLHFIIVLPVTNSQTLSTPVPDTENTFLQTVTFQIQTQDLKVKERI